MNYHFIYLGIEDDPSWVKSIWDTLKREQSNILQGIHVHVGNIDDGAEATVAVRREAWLPDGYSRIFRLYVFGPPGLKDYGSATLRCKI